MDRDENMAEPRSDSENANKGNLSVVSTTSDLSLPPDVLVDPNEYSVVGQLTDSSSSSLSDPPETLVDPSEEDVEMTDVEEEEESRFGDDYNKLAKIGSGGEGKVYVMQQRETGQLIVAKKMKQPGGDEPPLEARILDRLGKFDNPRILRIHGYEANHPDPSECTLYLEYCNGRDLLHFVNRFHRREVQVPERFVWHFLHQACGGLAVVHGRRIIHRDVKPENILLDWTTQDVPGLPNVKISDFGMAQIRDRWIDDDGNLDEDDRNYNEYIHDGGTFAWQPPEAPVATYKGDTWSLGGIARWICTGELPDHSNFSSNNEVPADEARQRGKGGRRWRPMLGLTDYGYTEKLDYAIGLLYKSDPDRRCSAQDWLLFFEDEMGIRVERSTERLPKWACQRDTRLEKLGIYGVVSEDRKGTD